MQFLLTMHYAMFQPCLLLFLFSLLHPLSYAQLNSIQNIEIFFPFTSPPPILSNSVPKFHHPPQQLPVAPLTRSSHHASNHNALVKAVVATMTSAIVVAGIILFFLHKSSLARRSRQNKKTTDRDRIRPGLQERDRIGGPVMKLKPLHWDKDDHSMVLDKTSRNSSGYNDDIMEAMFGYVATDRKFAGKNKISSNITTNPPAQVIILDTHKSPNCRTTVIRSLSVTREEILDAFLQGKTTLDIDTLEKLIQIAPNREEEALILEFDGNPTKLADAESFLYHLFQAVPSPFHRLQAMHFRANYETKILPLKETLQTLELGCIELQMHGFFSKLLEALKEEASMELKLDGSQNLFDVKGTHGTTTSLKFLVEELIRSEGRNTSMMMNEIHNLNPSDVGDEYYMMLGLQAFGDLNVKFCNARKATSINYHAFVETWLNLRDRADEIWKLLDVIIGDGEEDGFVREMERFLDEAEVELEVVRKGETRVLDVVKGIQEEAYYSQNGFGDQNENRDKPNPIQVFVILKEFICIVDQICAESLKV